MYVAVVGSSGAVGQELVSLLRKDGIEPVCFHSKSTISFTGIDIAYFCVSGELAKKWIPQARACGTTCIDSSSHYRSDPDVPLVIPEINSYALNSHQGIIASPNCTTTLMLLPLAPLHKKYGIKRIVATTYQAVSGRGMKAIEELKTQTNAHLNQEPLVADLFPSPCAFNVFPHESPLDNAGYAEEERKMEVETQKILEDPKVRVTARCVRVPVFRVHCQALNVEFFSPFSLDEMVEGVANAPGVKLVKTPTALEASEKKTVLCGRMRLDPTQPNTLELWVAGDQLLKGAALNMLQIAKELCFV